MYLYNSYDKHVTIDNLVHERHAEKNEKENEKKFNDYRFVIDL